MFKILIMVILLVNPEMAFGFKDSKFMGPKCSTCHTTDHRKNDIVRPVVISSTNLGFGTELYAIQFKKHLFLVNSNGGIIKY